MDKKFVGMVVTPKPDVAIDAEGNQLFVKNEVTSVAGLAVLFLLSLIDPTYASDVY